ncbi:MAG: hypothetical protein JXR60_10155 [Bacteroidales bacterium]|nr:hypothetical protein [Bacteroidales bacterium]
MRKAIIDLGTNTFNLLIANVENDGVEFLYKAKMPSKLGEDGINRLMIHEDACNRGLQILKEYKKIIEKHGVESVHAIATSAVRTAKNGAQFVEKIYENTGIEVEVISGEKEAELIFQGVRHSFHGENQPYLILDIGGGSTEFILVENEQITELKSFSLGMARLMERFHPSDPITSDELLAINAFLESELSAFFEHIRIKNVKLLVGSSGSFDTLLSMVAAKFFKPGFFKKNLSSEISIDHFNAICNQLIASTIVERRLMPGMDLIRVEMMVLATIFTQFVIKNLQMDRLIQSKYALKEGLLFSL